MSVETETLPDSAYIAFAKKLETALKENKSFILRQYFHPGLFAREVGATNAAERKEIKAFLQSFELGETIVKKIDAGHRFDFIRFFRKNEAPHVLFRLSGDDGFNYHDYKLNAIKGEGVVIQDCYFYLSGEWLSQSAARLILGAEQLNQEDLQLLIEVRSAADKGDFVAANEKFLKISPEGRDTKMAQLVYIRVVGGLGDPKLFKARLEYYEKSFPKDPGLPVVSYSAHLMREDYNGAIAQLQALRKTVGQDPFLDLEEAFCYLSQKRPDAAILLLKSAKKALNNNEDYYFAWLDVAIQTDDAALLLETLSTLYDHFGYDKTALSFILKDAYPDYSPDEQIKKWLEDK